MTLIGSHGVRAVRNCDARRGVYTSRRHASWLSRTFTVSPAIEISNTPTESCSLSLRERWRSIPLASWATSDSIKFAEVLSDGESASTELTSGFKANGGSVRQVE